MADQALQELSLWLDQLYAKAGRPSIPPEQLLRAQVLQVLYTIRSERQLMDQIDGNWRYRWFVGLKPDDPVWDVTVFTKNRDRLMRGEVSQKFFQKVREQASQAGLLDDEHFSVDGSLIEAWANRDSFMRKKIRRSVVQELEDGSCCGIHTKAKLTQKHGCTRRA